jgi:putative SOS response-associated peptidase YedK
LCAPPIDRGEAGPFYQRGIDQADGTTQQPFYITCGDQEMFGFAVWDSSTTAEGVRIHSCTIVTMPANKIMSKIHNAKQRMPAILRKEDRETWLKGDPESAFKALQQYHDELLIARPVSTRVNAPKNNDAALIEAIAA